MQKIKGPGIFLAQFAADESPFNSFAEICKWAGGIGFKGIQIPTWDKRLFDLETAATSQTYCDDIIGTAAAAGLSITELSTHLQGQLVAVNPAYDRMFDGFAPVELHNKPAERTAWAVQQLKHAAKASQRFNLQSHASFSGALLWHTFYPWPQRPQGLVDMGFAELAKRWVPILNAFDEAGVDVCYELHPGEDLHDGVTFERF